jgi:D-galactarolactone cycloisomerase
MIEGKNPLDVERLYEELYDVGRSSYQSVVPLPAISGIDIALWDLVGKIRDESVASLLGGRQRDSVRAYATGHYFKHEANLSEQYERITAEAEANAKKFGAVKAKIGLELLGYSPEEDIELVRRIRETVGSDTTLMIDANYAYDPGTARRVGRALEDLNAYWFEEPVPPEDIQGYADLRESLDVRIAGGECHTSYEFDRLFDAGAVDVAQPDLANVGGITAGRRIATQAAAHNIQVVPHVWGTPLAIAASLQIIATLNHRPWLEFDHSSNPLRTELMQGQFTICDGCVTVPSGSGLGIEVDTDAIERYRID